MGEGVTGECMITKPNRRQQTRKEKREIVFSFRLYTKKKDPGKGRLGGYTLVLRKEKLKQPSSMVG